MDPLTLLKILLVIVIILTYYYITRILPILLVTAIFLALIGMLIKVGTKAGYAVIIVLLSGAAFMYILYGNISLDLFKNLALKLKNYVFDFEGFKAIKSALSNNNNNQVNTSENNVNE